MMFKIFVALATIITLAYGLDAALESEIDEEWKAHIVI